MKKYKVGISNITGSGIIATEDISKGELIGEWVGRNVTNAIRYLSQPHMTETWYEIGDLGRYACHQDTKLTNTYVILDDYDDDGLDELLLFSDGILKDEEITVDYQICIDITGFQEDLSRFE